MPALYVVRRRKRLYFRLRAPAWLALHLGCSHLVQALKASDAKVAAGSTAGATAFWQKEFRRVRSLAVALSEKDLKAVVADREGCSGLKRRLLTRRLSGARGTQEISQLLKAVASLGLAYTSDSSCRSSALLLIHLSAGPLANAAL